MALLQRAMEPGDICEGYWPDDDTWLAASVSEVYTDGSFRIVWESDSCESDVPMDYLRWPPAPYAYDGNSAMAVSMTYLGVLARDLDNDLDSHSAPLLAAEVP